MHPFTHPAMDKISDTKQLYEFILEQSTLDIPDSQLMTLYMLAVQKNLDEDLYMLAINLSYILNLRSSGEKNVRNYFTTMKMKYYKYFGFWKEYLSFEIEEGSKPIQKVLESSIKYIDLKEFKDKEVIRAYLEEINERQRGGGSLREYVTVYTGRIIRVEEITYRSKVDTQNEELCKENMANVKVSVANVNKNTQHNDDEQGTRQSSENFQRNTRHNETYLYKEYVNFNKENEQGNTQTSEKFPYKENVQRHDKLIREDVNTKILNVQKKKGVSTPGCYSPYLKKVNREEDKVLSQLKTPISELNLSWNKKYPFKFEGASPERKLKFSSYQSPDKIQRVEIPLPVEDDTLEIKNMLEEVRSSENFRRKVEKVDHHCTISDKEYRKCGIIGKGGNSKVYLVENGNKFYALKVVNIEMDSKLKKSTLKEIDILRNLKGSYGIIELIDSRVDVDNIYILLEYGSIDLAKYIRKNTLSLNAVKFFWEQMLRILQVVHSNRIIHADIKPANFVIVDGNLKLIDFNISSKIKADTTRLDLESACGTLNYVAPEILDSSIKQRRRGSDVWSLGIILYEMLYKKVPVDYTTNSSDWLEKIQNMEEMIKDDGKVSPSILKTIRSCLRRNPKDRPTVDELLRDM